MHIPRLAAVITAVGIMTACTTIGNKFDPAFVDQLTPGTSTTDDAIRLLGKPSAVSTGANGSRLLQWQYVQGTPIGGSGAHVAVLFDQDGKMVRVTHRAQQ